MVNLSGKSAAGGPITVRLEPCGMGKAWLVDPAGKPVEGYRESLLIVMVVTPPARRSTWAISRADPPGSHRTFARQKPEERSIGR
jgi:hypothetical protein